MEEIVHVEVTKPATPGASIPEDSLEALLWSYGNSVHRAHLIAIFPGDQDTSSWEVSLVLIASTFPEEHVGFGNQSKKMLLQGETKTAKVADFSRQLREIFGAESKIGVIPARE